MKLDFNATIIVMIDALDAPRDGPIPHYNILQTSLEIKAHIYVGRRGPCELPDSSIVARSDIMASKKAFKSQASSSRALSGALGGFAEASRNESFGAPNASQLSHVYEPPDLAGLSDPQVVVLMKNLQKKDSTTKSKALDDLQIYLRSLQDDPGESFLEAWVRLHERTGVML